MQSTDKAQSMLTLASGVLKASFRTEAFIVAPFFATPTLLSRLSVVLCCFDEIYDVGSRKFMML